MSTTPQKHLEDFQYTSRLNTNAEQALGAPSLHAIKRSKNPATHMPLIDRILSRLGAGKLVRSRPGMGWMLVEIIPVQIWIRYTSAFSFENSFYLVALLLLLGAAPEQLRAIPMVYCLATLLHAVLIIRRCGHPEKRIDYRHSCLRDVLIGRGAWVLLPIWGMLGLWLDWSTNLILGGMLAFMFIGQLMLFTSVSLWATWTQDLIPTQLRGQFFAWRNLASMLVFSLVAYALSFIWPDEDHIDAWWYLGLFTVLGLISLASTLLLALAPDMPNAASYKQQRLPPLRQALQGQGCFQRFVCWNVGHMAAMACTAVYVPVLIKEAGVPDETYSWMDALIRNGAMIAGVLVSGAALMHFRASTVLLSMQLALMLSLGCLLSLGGGSGNANWLLMMILAAEGLARGIGMTAYMSRLYEVTPAGDPRFPAIAIGIGGLAGAAASGGQTWLIPLLDGLWNQSGTWMIVALGLLIRLASTPLLLDRRLAAQTNAQD